MSHLFLLRFESHVKVQLVNGAVAFLQDLSRLGRDLRRTVLVDDTPLAFLRQPDNGIPIFNFRHAPAHPFPSHCCAQLVSLP